jgi:hypothetical protein
MPQQQQQPPPQYGPPPTPPQQLAGSRAVVSAASTPAPAPQRIDPSAIPRPKYSNPLRPTRYRTTGEGQHVPPAAWSDFIAEDTGNVNPRFIRASLAHVPATRDVLKESRVPLSLIITPLAATAPGERPVTVVDFGAEGPIRCVRCRGYINRFVRWGEGGRVWGCNLCGARNECPGYYQGSIDQYGQRLDKHDRPELRDASVEFVAPPLFCVRPPAPMGVMFLVETTAAAVASGATRTALEAIRASLDGLAAAGMRAGLLTFDSCVQGYDIAPERRALRQVIAGDVDDGFAPLPPDQGMPLVAAARHQWEPLLERVLALFPPSASRAASACTGAALKAGVDALTECGGRVVLFAASLPSHGEGKLVHRERPGVYGSEKEKELCVPQVGSPATAFYQDLARTAASKAVSVHINVLSSSSIDLGTMAALVGITGGDARIYPSFAAPSAPGPAGAPGAGPGGLSKPPIGAPPGAMAGAGAAPSAPLGASQLGSSGVGAAGGGAAAAGEAAVPASVVERVVAETRELLCRETGVEAVLKVRTSPGVKVTGYLGNFLERGDDEADLPTLDSEKAVLAMLQHDGHELKDGEDLFVQAAVLFTTGFGARRIRVHNLWLKSTENLQAVFRHADIDTILSTLVRNGEGGTRGAAVSARRALRVAASGVGVCWSCFPVCRFLLLCSGGMTSTTPLAPLRLNSPASSSLHLPVPASPPPLCSHREHPHGARPGAGGARRDGAGDGDAAQLPQALRAALLARAAHPAGEPQAAARVSVRPVQDGSLRGQPPAARAGAGAQPVRRGRCPRGRAACECPVSQQPHAQPPRALHLPAPVRAAPPGRMGASPARLVSRGGEVVMQLCRP